VQAREKGKVFSASCAERGGKREKRRPFDRKPPHRPGHIGQKKKKEGGVAHVPPLSGEKGERREPLLTLRIRGLCLGTLVRKRKGNKALGERGEKGRGGNRSPASCKASRLTTAFRKKEKKGPPT